MSLTQTTLKLALPLAISLALAACGGGSSSDSSSSNDVGFGSNTSTDDSTDTTDSTDTDTTDDTATDDETTTESEISALVVYPSTYSLSTYSDPTERAANAATLYMSGKDSSSIALSDVTFTPSITSGNATLSTEVDTDDGTLTTWQLTPDNASEQTIGISITADGTLTETLEIVVGGTTLEIDGASSISINSGTASIYTVKLNDSLGTALTNQEVSISSDLLSETVFTDSQGEAQFELTPTSSGEFIITVSALGKETSKTVVVSPNSFELSAEGYDEDAGIGIGKMQNVTLEWSADGAPQAGETIYLSATRGEISSEGEAVDSVVTGSDGTASFQITSLTAGGTVITASDNTTDLSTSLALEFVSETPKYLNIQADPSIIAPLGTSSISAQVNDENDNPVKNQVVIFNLNDTVDGKLSSSQATTNSSGQASVVYTAGNATSALEGVVITSHIEGVAKTADEATTKGEEFFVEEDTTKLTVGGEAVRIAFGFDELISDSAPFYNKTFGVIVTDNAGNPVSDEQIDFTVTSTAYYKGYYTYDDEESDWVKIVTADCTDHVEDLDKDGWLDEGEDYNNSGSLEPTNSTTISGSGTTDDSGQATVDISYPQNFAGWEKVNLTATVSVNGTEYKEILELVLPVSAADMSSADVSPPNVQSPYGLESCISAD